MKSILHKNMINYQTNTFRALQSVPRRHNTFYNSTEFRVHELNKRLQQRTEVLHKNL